MSYHEVKVPWANVFQPHISGSSIALEQPVYHWLAQHYGVNAFTGNRLSKTYEISKFVESGGRWDSYVPGIGAQPNSGDMVVCFLFRDANDAMLFKLTWA